MQGRASAKQKRSLVRALSGAWPVLACEFASSHLVEKCFDFAVCLQALQRLDPESKTPLPKMCLFCR